MEPALIGLLAAALGGSVLIAAGWVSLRMRAFVKRAATTVGVVVDVRPRFRKGQQVPVLYDPACPAEAKIRSFVQLWLLPLALALIGAVLSTVGLMLK